METTKYIKTNWLNKHPEYLELEDINQEQKNEIENIAADYIFQISNTGIAICGACNKQISMKVKHKSVVRCPECNKELMVQHTWRMSRNAWKMEEYGMLAIPKVVSEKCMAIRYILARRSVMKEDFNTELKCPGFEIKEICRIYIHEDYALPVYLSFEERIDREDNNWKYYWIEGRNGYFRPDTYSIMCQNRHWIMYAKTYNKGLFEELNKLDCFKHYPVEDIYNEKLPLSQMHFHIRTARINEKLCKSGLSELVKQQIYYYENSGRYGLYDCRAWLYGDKPLLKTLNINRNQLKILKENPTKLTLENIRKYPYLTYEEFNVYKDFKLYKTCVNVSEKTNVSKTKVLRYIQKNNINCASYEHYLDMLTELEYDLKQTYYSMPKNFQQADLDISWEYDNKKYGYDKNYTAKDEIIKKISDGLRAMPDLKEFLHGSNGLLVKVPDSYMDFYRESKYLNNCFKTYVDKVIEEKTLVFCVRRLDKPDEPFVDMEYRNGQVVQIMYKSNIAVESLDDDESKKIVSFVEAFAERLRKAKVMVA